MLKPFSTFGMEPTFYPDIKSYPSWWDDSNTWSRVVEQVSDKIINQKLKHHWWKNAEVDEGVLEVPTPPYTTFKAFKNSWESLHKILEKYDYKNSSDVCIDGQGGCHITFSLNHLSDKKRWVHGNFKYKGPSFNWWERQTHVIIERSCHMSYKQLFCRNLLAFMVSNPTLVWSCLSPNDNISSTIPRHAFSAFAYDSTQMRKGEFLTFRSANCLYDLHENDKQLKRVELRFFMMPRSTEEMIFHFEMANKILNYVKHMTDQKRIIEITKTKRMLSNYTFAKAKRELKEVYRLLDISYAAYSELGKEKLLKKRFEYGKSYLV